MRTHPLVPGWRGVLALLLSITFAVVPRIPGAPAVAPDERDRQVLESLLLRLLTDSEFNMTRIAGDETTVVLNTQTPEKTGMIRPDQMAIDIGPGHSIPTGIQSDLRLRNEKPGSYESYRASFADLKFDRRIVVTNLMVLVRGDRFGRAFGQVHPGARAWVEAWLPGYSQDGTQAVVRAWIGPSDHGAVVTALLEKNGEKWQIKWHHLARFL